MKDVHNSGRTIAVVDQELERMADWRLESLASDATRELINKEWSVSSDNEQLIKRAGQVLSRRRYLKRLEKEKSAKAQQEQAQRESLFNQALQEFKTERRAIFGGSDAQFDAIWPELEKQFMLNQASAENALKANQKYLKSVFSGMNTL